jgi:predicted dehydrogenase
MKFLIVGLGSMGKRRTRNLQYLEAGEIVGFDIREDRRKETEQKYGIKTFTKFDEAMQSSPDALIISTPPDLHIKYGLEAAKNNKHFFMEASVVDYGLPELIDLCRKKAIVAAPSCAMRFIPSVKKIKEIVDSGIIGSVLSFTYHSGQYLPDWHPWEDIRKYYVSKRETGGAREIVPFELVWLTWVLGDIGTISCFKGKLSKLKADIDDVYQIIMKFESGVLGHLMVDVVSRTADRSFKIFGEEGSVFWDWGTGVNVYTSKGQTWTSYPERAGTTVKGYDEKIKEEPYIEEMDVFIKAIKKEKKYPYTLEEDKHILELLYAAEKSSDKQSHIKTAHK